MAAEADDPLGPEYIAALRVAFETDPEARLIMQVARRAGLPFSEVSERWSRRDLAYEVAWQAHEVETESRRCPGCGIDPEDMLKENGRDLGDQFLWRLEVRHCPFCEERAEAAARLSGGDYQRPPPHVYYRPRQPGEPFIDPEISLIG